MTDMRKVLPRALLGLVLSTSASHGGELAPRPLPGLQLEMRFDGVRRTEFFLNGVRIRNEPQERRMTCPQEGSCAGVVTVMAVATVASLLFLNELAKHRD